MKDQTGVYYFNVKNCEKFLYSNSTTFICVLVDPNFKFLKIFYFYVAFQFENIKASGILDGFYIINVNM